MKSFKDHIKKEAAELKHFRQQVHDVLYIGRGINHSVIEVPAELKVWLFKPVDYPTFVEVCEAYNASTKYQRFTGSERAEGLWGHVYRSLGFTAAVATLERYQKMPPVTLEWFRASDPYIHSTRIIRVL